jgi:hypothetical protein
MQRPIRTLLYFEPDPVVSGAVRTGATLITALHLRQSKVSKSGLSGLDLLANIATPQIGQCFMDRRCEVIALRPQTDACGIFTSPRRGEVKGARADVI